ncbi:hypothetical protein ACFVU2_09635 [Leifsonia sp. NPDC058194]|uniref:hypothetical protein n=1 Tax=Leifsonia sp. NPDC058194 TaxID=3346374 RepID=UPI0036DEC86C
MGRCRDRPQLAGSVFFVAFGVGTYVELISVNVIAAIPVPHFAWAAAWLTFTRALRTRARRRIDHPNDM